MTNPQVKAICVVPGCGKLVNGHGYCMTHYYRWVRYGDPLKGQRLRAPPGERLLRRVDKNGPGGCWIWMGGKGSSGYGAFQVGGHGSPTIGAHRYSYELHKGPIPNGLHVMHSCDNKLCVNPEHLSVGTHQDNMDDRDAKGRWNGGVSIGEASGAAVLTEAAVIEMRRSPISHADWARRLNVSVNAIRYARSGKTWTHLNDIAPPAAIDGRGERQHDAKLNEAAVQHIRSHPEVSLVTLARQYSTSPQAIGNVRRRKTWKHIP